MLKFKLTILLNKSKSIGIKKNVWQKFVDLDKHIFKLNQSIHW